MENMFISLESTKFSVPIPTELPQETVTSPPESSTGAAQVTTNTSVELSSKEKEGKDKEKDDSLLSRFRSSLASKEGDLKGATSSSEYSPPIAPMPLPVAEVPVEIKKKTTKTKKKVAKKVIDLPDDVAKNGTLASAVDVFPEGLPVAPSPPVDEADKSDPFTSSDPQEDSRLDGSGFQSLPAEDLKVTEQHPTRASSSSALSEYEDMGPVTHAPAPATTDVAKVKEEGEERVTRPFVPEIQRDSPGRASSDLTTQPSSDSYGLSSRLCNFSALVLTFSLVFLFLSVSFLVSFLFIFFFFFFSNFRCCFPAPCLQLGQYFCSKKAWRYQLLF